MKGNKYADRKGTVRPGKTAKGIAGIGKASPAAPARTTPQVSHKQKRKAQKKLNKQQQSDRMSEGEYFPPMPSVGDSGKPWDFRQAVVMDNSSRKKEQRRKEKEEKEEKKREATGSHPKSASVMMTCPGGHALRLFRTPHDEFFCEMCGDDQYLPRGTMLFGCRECDWDACEKHTHEDVKKREILLEQRMNAPTKNTKVNKEGVWKVMRGADKYKNEYMYLRHEGSRVLVELVGHGTHFTFRPGTVVKRLDEGEGHVLKKNLQLGNWHVVMLDDGAAVASNNAQYIKTSKHKEGEGPEGVLESQGLELHLTTSGELVWIAPDTQGDLALVLSAHQPPLRTTKAEAMKRLGLDDESEQGEGEKEGSLGTPAGSSDDE